MEVTNRPYDLAVVYRICPVMSRSASEVFGGDKFLLSQVALESFKESLGNMRVKMWVLFDNCPEPYVSLFNKLWDTHDLMLEHHPGIGNRGTLLRQFQIIAEQEDAEIVYLAEDDYVYHANAFEDVVGLLHERPEVDFVTPYYHRDYETLSMHRHNEHTLRFADRTWKTVKMTTGTFATRRAVFRATHHVFETLLQKVLFSKMSDAAVWLALTKYDVFNPWSWITWPPRHPFLGWSLFAAWRLCWRQILFGKRYQLWAPEPSVCTHLAEGLMPSSYEWAEDVQSRIAKIKKQTCQFEQNP